MLSLGDGDQELSNRHQTRTGEQVRRPSHAPATIAKTTIELIGKAMTTSRRARSALREDAPATFGQLLMVDRQRGLNNGVSQPNSGANIYLVIRMAYKTLPKWFRSYR